MMIKLTLYTILEYFLIETQWTYEDWNKNV